MICVSFVDRSALDTDISHLHPSSPRLHPFCIQKVRVAGRGALSALCATAKKSKSEPIVQYFGRHRRRSIILKEADTQCVTHTVVVASEKENSHAVA
jgi:hypothetical protein